MTNWLKTWLAHGCGMCQPARKHRSLRGEFDSQVPLHHLSEGVYPKNNYVNDNKTQNKQHHRIVLQKGLSEEPSSRGVC
ncbi:hypothetical protein GBAR_LOCUS27490 [Geodia barretti]|uniref:Uncharacterized protein n=1 Tax=Geodia barretti TaxID=519541 RepID=A0AA35TL05_GEOBA|nr:hypothetical protein GBAR_LOCUS27490 [Geodia barretti]